MAFWLTHQPSAFIMVRGAGGGTRGFLCSLLLSHAEATHPDVLAHDPRVAAAVDHMRSQAPVRDGDRLCLDSWLDYETHMAPGALVSQQSVRNIQIWFGAPSIAFSFIVINGDVDPWRPLMDYLDHSEVAAVPLSPTGVATHALFAHDWRTVSPDAFLDMMAEREVLGTAATPAPPAVPAPLVLSQDAFDDAVRAALRVCTQPDALADNALMRCRVVLEAPPAETGTHPLRNVLLQALDTLTHSGKDESLHGAVKLTYLDPSRNQQEAAELLGLPFSTYRRHLAAGVERIVDWLWQRELHGYDA